MSALIKSLKFAQITNKNPVAIYTVARNRKCYSLSSTHSPFQCLPDWLLCQRKRNIRFDCVLYVTHRIQTSFTHAVHCVYEAVQWPSVENGGIIFLFSAFFFQTGIKITSRASIQRQKKNDVRPPRSMECCPRNTSRTRMMVSEWCAVCGVRAICQTHENELFWISVIFRYGQRRLPTFARCTRRTSRHQLSIRLSGIETKFPGARACPTRFLRWNTLRYPGRSAISDVGHGYRIFISYRRIILTLLVVGWQETVPTSVTETIARLRSGSLHVRTENDVNWERRNQSASSSRPT